MILNATFLKDTRYAASIVAVFVGTLALCDAYVHSHLSLLRILATFAILTFPVFLLHVLYVVQLKRQEGVADATLHESAQVRSTLDMVLMYAYVALVGIVALMYVTSIDQSARDRASERANRDVPNPSDLSTSVQSTGDTDGLPASPLLLTKDRVLSSSIELSTFSFVLYDGSDSSTGFGKVVFEQGAATSCEPLEGNGYYTCDTFAPDMLVIKDVLAITATTSAQYLPEASMGEDVLAQTGLIIAERTYQGKVDTVMFFVTNDSVYSGYSASTFSVVGTFVLAEAPVSEAYFEGVTNITALNVGRYDQVVVMLDGNRQAYILETQNTKYNDFVSLYPSDSGTIDKVFPITFYEPTNESSRSANAVSIGALHHVFVPGRYFIWSGRSTAGDIFAAAPIEDRLYFKAACGMPNRYADFAVSIVSDNLWLGFTASIPQSATYNVTTTNYGYEPSAWGKVLEVKSVAEELQKVIDGIASTERTAEQLTIAGTPVLHTLPSASARPCEVEGSQQMYQWVKDGNLYSVTHTAATTGEGVAAQPEIEGVIAELIAGMSYVPSSN